jgi:Helix-turn-helix
VVRSGKRLFNRLPDLTLLMRPLMGRKKASPTLADVIHQTIIDRGLSSYAVGKLAGVDESQIQRFMNGERDLTLATGGKVATALGLALVPTDPPAE